MNKKQYNPEVFIELGYIEFLEDNWVKNEFIYKNNNLVSLSIHELMCNPIKDKPSFKIISLSNKTYLETYFSFIEVKHIISIKEPLEINYHNVTLTKYVKCNRYDSSIAFASDIICELQQDKSYVLCKPNSNNLKGSHYKFSHSYYKSEYYETLNSYKSQVLIEPTQIIVNLVNELDHTYNPEFIINKPILYNMGLDFELYKSLFN